MEGAPAGVPETATAGASTATVADVSEGKARTARRRPPAGAEADAMDVVCRPSAVAVTTWMVGVWAGPHSLLAETAGEVVLGCYHPRRAAAAVELVLVGRRPPSAGAGVELVRVGVRQLPARTATVVWMWGH